MESPIPFSFVSVNQKVLPMFRTHDCKKAGYAARTKRFFSDPMIFMGWRGRGASVQSCKALPTQKAPIRNERNSPTPARESHEIRDALMINEEMSDKRQLEWMNPEEARNIKLRERICQDGMKPEKKMDPPNTKAHAARVRKGGCFTCPRSLRLEAPNTKAYQHHYNSWFHVCVSHHMDVDRRE